MRKETDLARVKMIAHVLLDMPIAETSFSPAIVSHPFTSTGVTAAQNEDGNITVVDLLNNKEDYDNDKTAILNLPATDAAIWRAVEAVDAASEEECAFRCTDCLLPSLRDAINDAIDEEGGIGQINEFAQLLAQKNQIWHANDLVKYKALLSVAGHPSLQDAMQLMHGLDAYELRPEVAQTWEYAEAALREKYPDLPEVLFQTPQAGQVGRELLERDPAVITDYGLLRRKDGGQLPVFQPEQQENEITGPAFAGM